MGSTLKLLAAKQVSSSTKGATTDLTQTTTAAKGWIIKNIYFYNYSSTPGQTVTVDLWIKQVATRRLLKKAALIVDPSVTTNGQPVVLQKEITLDLTVPDVLSVVMTSSSGSPNVDCVVNGVEKDQ